MFVFEQNQNLITNFDDFALISKFTVLVVFAVLLTVLQMKADLNCVWKFELHNVVSVELKINYAGLIIGGFYLISQHQNFVFVFPIEKRIHFIF